MVCVVGLLLFVLCWVEFLMMFEVECIWDEGVVVWFCMFISYGDLVMDVLYCKIVCSKGYNIMILLYQLFEIEKCVKGGEFQVVIFLCVKWVYVIWLYQVGEMESQSCEWFRWNWGQIKEQYCFQKQFGCKCYVWFMFMVWLFKKV